MCTGSKLMRLLRAVVLGLGGGHGVVGRVGKESNGRETEGKLRLSRMMWACTRLPKVTKGKQKGLNRKENETANLKKFAASLGQPVI